MKRLLILLAITTSLYCFGQDVPVYNHEAIEMNAKAGEYLQRSQEDSALFFFDKAIELDASYTLPHSNKVTIYLNRKDLNKALLECKMIVKKQPKMAEAWTFTGLIYDELKQKEEAKRCYQTSIDIFVERIEDKALSNRTMINRLNKAVSFILMEEKEKGSAELNQLQKEYPNNPMISQISKFSKQELKKQLLGI